MAEKKTNGKKNSGNAVLIDPIYQKFTRGVLRAISSTEFYEYFMDAIANAENTFQFSNRKLEKAVDLNWVDQIEQALPAMQNIISNPRNMIREEELIVNAAIAKRAGSDVVRHLTQHAAYVEDYDQSSGDVRPTKLMQKIRDDSEELYENRLVFTTMEMAFRFVKIRHDALFEAMSDEFGAKLKVNSDMQSATEMVHLEMFLHIKETESAIDADERNADTFNRISRIYRLLATFMNSAFAKQMAKVPRIKGNIVKTNVLKKHPDYRRVAKLLEFLRTYDQIGYSIRVIEQAPQINETFQRDIYHNILFNYMILKGYLQDESDRVVPVAAKEHRKTLKPKFIRQIVEELTEDYDLPDVEIRKVLIEQLTKEQLMHEEAEQRRKLVEEQARKKKEEEERLRKERAAEKERIRKEREAEKERIRQEQEAEKQRLFHERMLREAEDRRRSGIFRAEIARFEEKKSDQLEVRAKDQARYLAEQEDFADAAMLVEQAEQRKLAALERKRRREEEERERIQRERMEQLERERQEEERRRQLQERAALDRQIAIDMEYLCEYDAVLKSFDKMLPARRQIRADYEKSVKEARAQWLAQRRGQQAKAGQKTPV
ncbi:MAG: hypothetical protein E7470_00140 [Ruminococcaceae bacterium]|nr:hypothetical protein [Oscillospiraceae bacterium]